MSLASWVVAHRGLQRLYPENTLASVLGALDAGLSQVEVDVQLSADGVPVLHHDADLRRMNGLALDIRRLPWSRLRALAVPEAGRFGRYHRRERLASLEQLALALAGRRRFTLFVELKEESLRAFGRERMLAAVADALAPIRRRCALISFDLEVLRLARRDTRFPVGLVLRRLDQLKSPALRALAPEWIFCDAAKLPRRGSLRSLFGGARACVYEVPQVERARALLGRGVFAVETFKADILLQELERFR